jgi:ABC-type transport system involved in multi-copper enzyme maturation permease subunit
MSSYGFALSPARSLVSADLLKLRRSRGLVAVTALLTIGATVITFGVMEVMHLVNSTKHGPAGGITNLGHAAFVVAALGAVAATIVASSAAVGDLDSGVYRDLVVTGRSRLALYLSRIPAGFLFLFPFVATAYALAAVASVGLAGGNPVPGVHLLWTTGLWTLLEVFFYYLVSFGIACLVASRAYTIGIVLAFRLALTPLLASISALGFVRELIPGVGIQDLAPAGLGDSIRQGPHVGMTTAAIAAVLVVWTVAALVAGAWRDTTRDA